MKRLILATALVAFTIPAFAQTKQGFRLPITIGQQRTDSTDSAAGGTTGNFKSVRQKVLTTLAKPFQDIADLIGDDVSEAIALSTAIPDLQDGHGQQCWIALRNFSAVAKAHPLPLTGKIATDLEALRLYAISANRLCGDVHCTQMFSDFTAMAQSVATAVAGPLGSLGAKAVTPSLQDACTKIPQIPLVDPVNPVPPAPDIKPIGLQ
jgi:hypothetical protein